MINNFKKIYMINIYETLSKKLKILALNHNLKYEELEELYLKDIKNFIENN